MSTIITIENLGKKYTLRHQQREQYTALRDVITNGVISLGKRLIHPFSHQSSDSTLCPASEDFWALKDVSFEVKQGERIGIIGRNGAGKSTLLKILSRITEPTTGSVRIKGRVASLLEVGTGFHPELTGRENIYLNGAILGMTRVEIKKKFDEIVDFAEIEKFLDTPVKRYSSGMYVRLAFAVAAHLEPEILVVDEVLAVGDAQFQKKCLGKMEQAGGEGRTVLFVSHNIGAVRQLCTSAMLLSSGVMVTCGDVERTLDEYLQAISTDQAANRGTIAFNANLGISLESFRLLNDRDCPAAALESGKRGALEFTFSSLGHHPRCLIAVTIDSLEDVRVCALHNAVSGFEIELNTPGAVVCCTIPRISLPPGNYYLNFKLRISDQVVFFLPRFFNLQVEDGDFYGTGRLPEKSWGGVSLIEQTWSTVPKHDGFIPPDSLSFRK